MSGFGVLPLSYSFNRLLQTRQRETAFSAQHWIKKTSKKFERFHILILVFVLNLIEVNINFKCESEHFSLSGILEARLILHFLSSSSMHTVVAHLQATLQPASN